MSAEPTPAVPHILDINSKALTQAVRPFIAEIRWKSWFAVISTLLITGLALTYAALPLWWPLRLLAGTVAGLLLVRCFILYHDFLHGSILARSRWATGLMHGIGAILLVPARSWRKSHNYHHAHVGKPSQSHVGSFVIMSLEEWQQASTLERLIYRFSRHWLVFLSAYFTVFALNVCIMPLLRNPRRHWDSAIVLLVHVGLLAGLFLLGGWSMLLFTAAIPLFVASTTGAYLFYVQHSFDGIHIADESNWKRTNAALETSSYLHTGPIMRYFSGNIGYHHVHHADHRIPFYRLPEAMAAVPELTPRSRITLSPATIWRSLQLHVWDARQGTMITLRQARKSLRTDTEATALPAAAA
ncbi:MAG: fatty acid desaturase [Planctomycetota bacterium]|nr:MAG: fatty acid desaturase [Planctomycetota bacterium]